MTAQDEDRDTVPNLAYNPFPEPQTIPSGWDTSGFFSEPEPFDLAQDKPASVTEDDSAFEADNH